MTAPEAVKPPEIVVFPATFSVLPSAAAPDALKVAATDAEPLRVKPLKVGLEVVAIDCGKLRVTSDPTSNTFTWSVVPLMLLIALVLLKLLPVSVKPLPKVMAPVAPPRLVTVEVGAPVT